MSNEKSKQLGMSFGKANSQLRKMIMFNLVKECNKDVCYRCNKKIEKIEDLSIQHKISWMYSKNPKELFFDLTNIAFSHLSCNSKSKNYRLSEKGRQKISLANKGENSYRSKLSNIQRNEIKNRAINGETLRKLGNIYKVCHSTIQNIKDNF